MKRMASQINPLSQRQIGTMIGVSEKIVNYHINKTLKLKVRQKLQVHRLTKVNIEKRKKPSWGLYRALNNETTLEVYQRRQNHSSGFMVWGRVSFNGKAKLHFIDPGAKVNSIYYIDNVLKPFLTRDASRLYPDGHFDFHHDFAPSKQQLWRTKAKNVAALKRAVKLITTSDTSSAPQASDLIDKTAFISSVSVIELNLKKVATDWL
ncbi:hypothetical protein ILUMI_23540 [Ignelater luminosus]|uniref:Uncharacterized protein n=1 Tax=Ignelater luminosus TaxID=2038154 RepID=A0A8K0CCA0_IGNLU|nr:hypothetical protein ILUMI_23540 [Ignelater luminosus]